MAGRRLQWGAALLALAGVAWACDDWAVWDDMFKRTAVQSSPRGWTGGDGAISAALPNNRALWIFGDSYLTSWDANARRTELRDPTDPGILNDVVLGTTIAIQDDKVDPNPAGTRFYARQAPGHFDFHGTLLLTPTEEITQGRPASSGYTQFFNHVMLRRTPPASGGPLTILWPSGAECLDCGNAANARLLVGFTEVQLCDPTIHSPCQAMCEYLQIPENPCRHGVNVSGSAVARIKGIDQAPSAWSVDFTTSSPNVAWFSGGSVQWGKAFIEEGGYIYVYGVKGKDLVLARVPKADVMTNSSWRFLNTSNRWVASPSSLKVVAPQVGAMVSVDSITPTGKVKQYVLVHGDVGHHMFVRTSSSKTSWPGPNNTTPRLDLVSIDSTLGFQVLDLDARDAAACNMVTSLAGVQDYRGCGVVYHGLGHHHLSASDGSRLLASYIVPWGPNPWFNAAAGESQSNPATGAQDTRYYRPKFVNLDLTMLKPWCTTTNGCWEGLVKWYPQRALGGSRFSYDYDISQSARFYAELTRMAGSANMKVEHRGNNGSPLLRTDTCAASGGTLTCNVAKASGATVARVGVTGVASDRYILRTHYAGAF